MCKLIGIGGFGRVTFKENQKEIARKELLLDHVTNELAQLRFKREIESLRKIKSEYIVKITDYDVKYQWYEMPYYKYNLLTYVQREKGSEDLSIEKIIDRLIKGIKVLDSENMVHRDIKPQNILMNTLDDVVLCDLGLVKTENNTTLTVTHNEVGTMDFSAPEQFRDAKHVDIRADIYSIGRVMEWMFEKVNSYKNNTTNVVPDNYKSFIRKCTASKEDERYQTVDELQKAFKMRLNDSVKVEIKKMVNDILNDSESYKNFIGLNEKDFEKILESDMYKIITEGKIEEWLLNDFESFDCLYNTWDKKRIQSYEQKSYYPAINFDSIATNFYDYIINNNIDISTRTSLLKKLINHWGNRYNVMYVIFNILSNNICDDDFYTNLVDNLTTDEFSNLSNFYNQVGKNYNNISEYIMSRIENR